MTLAELAKHVTMRLGGSAHLTLKHDVKRSGEVEVRIKIRSGHLSGIGRLDDARSLQVLADMVDFVAGVRDIRGNLLKAPK